MNNHIYKEFEVATLEKVRYGLWRAISLNALRDMVNIETFIDRFTNNVVLKLKADIYSDKLQNEEVLRRYPKTLWQYFKRKYFPYWFKRKFPVKYEYVTIKFERKALFPNIAKYLSHTYGEEAARFFIHEGINIRKEKT